MRRPSLISIWPLLWDMITRVLQYPRVLLQPDRRLGQFIQDLSEYTKLRPNDPYGFVIRGWCYNDKGDLTRAKNDFINFLDLAGDDPEFESNREPVESWLASH